MDMTEKAMEKFMILFSVKKIKTFTSEGQFGMAFIMANCQLFLPIVCAI